jgi:hypothetical protein
VVEASVWWKRSERSGNVDSPRDFKMAIVPPRTGRDVSAPHMLKFCCILSMECRFYVRAGVRTAARR